MSGNFLKIWAVLCGAAVVFPAAGCAHLNHTENGALVGTGIGATAGSIIGHQSGHAGGGALIGAAAGALGGALVGNAQQMQEERDAAIAAAQHSEWRRHVDATAMTNQDVIRMTQAGVSSDVIAGTIRRQGGRFDLTPDGVIALKSQGVGDDVIQAMQQNIAPQYVSGTSTIAAAPSTTVIAVPPPPPTVYVAPRPAARVVVGPRRWHRRHHRHPHFHVHW